jgi:hypothetical protein
MQCEVEKGKKERRERGKQKVRERGIERGGKERRGDIKGEWRRYRKRDKMIEKLGKRGETEKGRQGGEEEGVKLREREIAWNIKDSAV